MEGFTAIPGLLIHIHSLEVRCAATPMAMRTLAIQACSMMGLAGLEPDLVRMSPWWCVPRESRISADGRPLRAIDMGPGEATPSGKPPVELGEMMGWNIRLVADHQLPPHIILVKSRGDIERYVMGVLEHQAQPAMGEDGSGMVCPRCGETTARQTLGDNPPPPWKCGNKMCGYSLPNGYSVKPSAMNYGVCGGTITSGCQIPTVQYDPRIPVGAENANTTNPAPAGEEMGPGLINITRLDGGTEFLSPGEAATRIWQHYLAHSMSEISVSAFREMVVREIGRRADLSDQSKNILIEHFDRLASDYSESERRRNQNQTAGETVTNGQTSDMVVEREASRRHRRGRWWRGSS